MKSAIIIGASSGIGRALAVTLSTDGYGVGLVARRTDLLTQLGAQLPGPCLIKTVDVSQPELAMALLRELIEELCDVELFIISAGAGFENAALAWEPERDTIVLNVLGFAGVVNVAVAHLEARGWGIWSRSPLWLGCGAMEVRQPTPLQRHSCRTICRE